MAENDSNTSQQMGGKPRTGGRPGSELLPIASPPQIVWVHPDTGEVVQTTDAAQIAKLWGQGYVRKQINGALYDQMKPSIINLDAPPVDLPFLPASPELTDQERWDIAVGNNQINAGAGATQENLLRAFNITQPGRDRSVLQTNEDYGLKVLPTTTAAAISGAGDYQANADLFMERVGRDRQLANLSDAQTSAEFQLGSSQQETEFARQQQIQQLYNQFINQAQTRYDKTLDAMLGYIQ